MSRVKRTLAKILGGAADTNIAFREVLTLLRALGFTERIRGDHHIFTRTGVEEILNIQPVGAKSKPYQVKQIRLVIVKYKLGELE